MNPDIAKLAGLIADPSRATMLLALLGGRTLPASELARIAKVTPQTASFHLAKMVEGGLLAVEHHGRHRYYRLADEHIAQALESLLVIAPETPIRSLRQSDQSKALHFARTCYDHLAGSVGVAVTDALVRQGYLRPSGADFYITPEGRRWFIDFGIDLVRVERSRRKLARQCLDWTQRRHHLAGALGAALTERMFDLQWIERVANVRAVRVTELGHRGLREQFGVDIAQSREQ